MIPKALMDEAVKGDADAQYKVGVEYCLGKNVDYAKAAEWFAKAAENGSLAAKRELGILYLRGDGVKADAGKAYPLISAAAKALDPNAMYHLALMYEKGIGVQQDLYEAIKLLAYAASIDYPGAEMDADRVYEIIAEKRNRNLRARPLLNLEISDVDVMAACCKPMLEDMLSEKTAVVDSFEGSHLVGEDEDGNEITLEKCPHCGKAIKKVSRNKIY